MIPKNVINSLELRRGADNQQLAVWAGRGLGKAGVRREALRGCRGRGGGTGRGDGARAWVPGHPLEDPSSPQSRH